MRARRMADAVDTQRSLFVRGVRLANEASGEDALLGGGRDPRVVAARDRLLAMHAAALAALRQSIGAADGRTPESRDMAAGAQRLVAQLEERSAALARLRSPAHAQRRTKRKRRRREREERITFSQTQKVKKKGTVKTSHHKRTPS